MLIELTYDILIILQNHLDNYQMTKHVHIKLLQPQIKTESFPTKTRKINTNQTIISDQ